MALPVITKTWIISPNNRIAYTTLAAAMGAYLFGIKEFLKANGYVVIGSSNGVTATPSGALTLLNDGVDRWVTSANASVRGANAASAQSWIVLRDGNGVDVLLAFQGSGDSIARISFSPGQLFISAAPGTPQPTATDEQVVSVATTLLTTGAADRVWHGWVSDDQKHCRFVVFSQGVVVSAWGVEEITSAVTGDVVIFNPPAVGFAYNRSGLVNAHNSYIASTRAGIARVTGSSVGMTTELNGGQEAQGGNAILSSVHSQRNLLQGGVGYNVWPMAWWAPTTLAIGKLGNRIDWWAGNDTNGKLCESRQFINLATTIWPWDGVTIPAPY